MRHFAAGQTCNQHELETAKLGSQLNLFAKARFEDVWMRFSMKCEYLEFQLGFRKMSIFTFCVGIPPKERFSNRKPVEVKAVVFVMKRRMLSLASLRGLNFCAEIRFFAFRALAS